MSTELRDAAPSRVRRRLPAAGWGLLAALVLMALAVAVPPLTGWNVHIRVVPPLYASWAPRVGVGTVPAVVLAVLLALGALRWCETLSWRRLLLLVYLCGLAWMLALAYVDGSAGIGDVLGSHHEYLDTARATTDVPRMLGEYVARIPFRAPDNWVIHVAGHPPGALLFFVALVHLGLGSGYCAGLVVSLLAASATVAVLITMRVLGAEPLARRAAPFLAVGPAAIWLAVSADAMFSAVAAWGLASLALAASRRSPAWSVLAGLLLGSAVMMSYGLPLLGVLALAVLVAARGWFPLLPAAVTAAVVVLVFAAFGFRYWEALPVIHQRYFAGIAHNRPPSYWMWGDLAALCFSTGPLVGAGLAHVLSIARHRWDDVSWRTATLLSGGGLATVLLADLSQMSRGEVERIWLPFVPWLLVCCGLLPERWRRWGLVGQLVLALLVQHLLHTPW